ncbi:MAG: 30S ribosome-binding factor RbfA [Candidatus Kapaibacteriales bacterium]
MSIRTERVASEIQKVLSLPLSDFARQNNAGIFTITAVKMSSDLSIAKIYFSTFGGKISPQTFLNLLEDEKATFRQFVGSKIKLRQTPELRFYYDDAFDRIENIKNLLSQDKKL